MDQALNAPLFGLSERIVASLLEVFARYPAVAQVLVYGSRATATYKPGSDIDLAVYAPAMSPREFALLWNALDDLPIIFKLDVAWMNEVGNASFRRNIERDGVPLYRRSQQASLFQPLDPGGTGAVGR